MDEVQRLVPTRYKPQPNCPNCGYLLALSMNDDGFVSDINEPGLDRTFTSKRPGRGEWVFDCPACYWRIHLTMGMIGEVWSYTIT